MADRPAELDPWLSQRLAASEVFVDAEARMLKAVQDTIKAWLAEVRRLVLGDPAEVVTAAGPPDLSGLAASDPEWEAALQRIARPVIEDLFSERFLVTARVATISDQPYRQAFIEEVFSRLVLFPAEQFELIRPELEEAISEGETVEAIRERISAVLDFDTTLGARGEQAETRRIQARINEIERILDAGGATVQEAAALRVERRRLYPELYESRRHWQWKAQRIARTETSMALNGGSYWGAVANSEILGTSIYHQWLSTDDERTRPTHVAADGQVRRLRRPFDVGGFPLRHPGDPLGPPHETIQCRCTALYIDADDLTDDQRAQADADLGDDDTGGVAAEPDLGDLPGAVDALTTPADEAPALVEVDTDAGPVMVPADLVADVAPADLEPYTFDQLIAVYPRYAELDVEGSLRILERLDALESLANAAQSEAADAAVEAMVEAGDVAAAIETTDAAWQAVGDAWSTGWVDDDGEVDAPPPPWAPGTEPEPRGEGIGQRYDPERDTTVDDADVPAGWVLYEDPYTGERTYYEAAGLPKQKSRTQRIADAKRAYSDWVHQQWLDAEEATKGNLFSAQGRKSGMPESALWSSNATSARAWASEELLRYWQDHPRLTQVEWLYQETGDERYRTQAIKARENNAKVLSSFTLTSPFLVPVGERGRVRPATLADRLALAALGRVAELGDQLAAAASSSRTGYSRAELAGAYYAGQRAGQAGAPVTSCPHRPRGAGALALLWVRGWRSQNPETIISSGETIMDLPNGWRGVMAALDVPTGDGRMLATPDGGVTLRTKPISLMWQERLAPAHDGAVVVGRVDRAWMDTTPAGVKVVMGEGPLDLGGGHGREAARLLAEGFFNGASLDPDQVEFRQEYRDADGNAVDPPAPADDGDELDDDYFDAVDDFLERVHTGELTALSVMYGWRIMAATLTPQSAFNETRIEPLYDYVPAGDQSGDLVSVVAGAGDVYEPADGPLIGRVIQPAPAEHYADPKLTRPTPLTITDDGRVFGHIAAWDTCHIGIGNVCVTPPHSLTAYAHFHLGEVATDAGRLAAGKLTIGGGHADPKLGFRAAIEHYDNVAAAVAAVRAGEDEHGIWVAGRVLSGVDAPILERFLLCPPSGDWRRISGNLELVAACSVNTAGYPVPRTLAAAAAGIQTSLVAAGAAPLMRRRRREAAHGRVDIDALAARVARKVRTFDMRAQRADQLAARIGRDDRTRAARAIARLDTKRGE